MFEAGAEIFWLALAPSPEAAGVEALLAPTGFSLRMCDAVAGLRAAARRRAPDLIVADLAGWAGDPRRLVQSIRRSPATKRIPLLFLSDSASRAEATALALRGGADEFVMRPVTVDLLAARIEAAVSTARQFTAPEPWSRHSLRTRDGRLVLDLRERRCHAQSGLDYQEIVLTRKQFDVLAALVRHPNRTVGWEKLYERGWRPSRLRRRSRTLVQHVMRLRMKLGPLGQRLEVVAGFGYRWRD